MRTGVVRFFLFRGINHFLRDDTIFGAKPNGILRHRMR